MPAYCLPPPYHRTPLKRRLSGLALALGVNLALIALLMTLGVIPPPGENGRGGIVVELIPNRKSAAPDQSRQSRPERRQVAKQKPVPSLTPPPIVLPVKPTIAPPARLSPQDNPLPWIEMSRAEMAGADVRSLAKAASGAGEDSAVVGRAPNGDLLYAAEWAREPTDAELGGYLPRGAPDGFGLIACKTVAGNRVEDCIELSQSPAGSHLASAVRQAAWQFRVRPPRKNGQPLIGSWVRIRIDYIRSGGDSGR